MKINWKIRLKNKTFILAISALIVALVYQVLAVFDIVPGVAQDKIIELIGIVVNILAMLGVVVDPTTDGINDSARAMTYGTPEDVRLKKSKGDNNA